MKKIFHLPYHISYYAQIASPELAEAIFAQGLDPALDPRWAESGADSPQEYSYWTDRACGVACLKMCVEALGGPNRSLVAWARDGLQRGGYLIRHDENGNAHEVGWVHSALADMAREVSLEAEVRVATVDEIAEMLQEGKIVIASVSYEAGDERLEITRKGGHLIVVHGAEFDESGLLAFFVHNPSGRKAAWQVDARLNIARFTAAYSGRAIVLSKL